MDLSKYVALFLTEGREHIAEMNAALLVLERADGSDPGPQVASLFRSVHTIKGMAAAMQYTDVADRSHALETILDGVRHGRDPITPALVSHLYDETDALARAVEQAAAGGVVTGGVAGETSASSAGDVPGTSRARRAEFLSRHVRVDASRLDALMDIAGELEIARLRLERIADENDPDALKAAVARMSRLIGDMREQVVTVRMVPVGHVFERFPRLVRETARALDKDIEFVIDGKDIELDRSTLDEIGDPVMHLLRNAIDHGLETAAAREAAGKPGRGRLTLSAQRETNYVVIRVADDGRGIDRNDVLGRAQRSGLVEASRAQLTDSELLDVLTHPGFSTAARVTDVSGRGVGLDVVDAAVRRLGGSLDIRTVMGRGTALTLRLPLTVAVIRALLAKLGNETVAIPITNVIETVELDLVGMTDELGRPATMIRDEAFPVIHLRDAVGLPTRTTAHPKAVTVDVRGRRAALVVDDFVGQQDVVVKRFDAVHGAPELFGGATILSDGAPALIVDVTRVV